jgi:hypothetical protein
MFDVPEISWLIPIRKDHCFKKINGYLASQSLVVFDVNDRTQVL